MNPWIKGFAIPHELIVNSSVSLMEGPHFFFFIIEILYCHTAQNYWLGSRQLNTCMAINFYYYPVCWVLNSLCPHFLNKKWPASSFGGGCPFFSGLHPTWENDWLITAQHSISLLTFFLLADHSPTPFFVLNCLHIMWSYHYHRPVMFLTGQSACVLWLRSTLNSSIVGQ